MADTAHRTRHTATLVFLCCAASSSLVDAGEYDKSAVIEAWRQNQEQSGGIRMVWDERRDNYRVPVMSEGGAFNSRAGNVWWTTRNVLLLDGTRVRLTEERVEASDTQFYPFRKKTMVFDGEVQKGFGYFDGQEEAQGGIASESFLTVPSQNYLPLTLLFRPADPELIHFATDEIVMTDDEQQFDDGVCVKAEVLIGQTPDSSYILWLMPDRGFSVRRFEEVRNGKRVSQYDLHLQKNPEYQVWTPTNWECQMFDGTAALLSTLSATVNEFELHPALAEADFVVEFPPGTRYFDHRRDGARMVVTSHGNVEPLPPPSIVNSAQPLANEGRSNRAVWWIVGGNLIVFALLVALIVRRRSQRTAGGG